MSDLLKRFGEATELVQAMPQLDVTLHNIAPGQTPRTLVSFSPEDFFHPGLRRSVDGQTLGGYTVSEPAADGMLQIAAHRVWKVGEELTPVESNILRGPRSRFTEAALVIKGDPEEVALSTITFILDSLQAAKKDPGSVARI